MGLMEDRPWRLWWNVLADQAHPAPPKSVSYSDAVNAWNAFWDNNYTMTKDVDQGVILGRNVPQWTHIGADRIDYVDAPGYPGSIPNSNGNPLPASRGREAWLWFAVKVTATGNVGGPKIANYKAYLHATSVDGVW